MARKQRFKIINQMVNDTLKKVDEKTGKLRFSNTSLTMFSSWIIVCSSYTADQILHGFRYEAWLVLVSVSLGVNITKALAEKIKK